MFVGLQCLLLEAGVTPGGEDAIEAAHEASERIFSYLSDVVATMPQYDGSFDNSTVPLAFTTGPSAACGELLSIVKKSTH